MNNKEKYRLETFFSIVYIFILYLFTYIIKFDNTFSSFKIIEMLICSAGIQYIIIGYLIILSMFMILKGVIKDNLKVNIVVTITVITITIISYYKYKILELPFVPNDIGLIGNINQIINFGILFPSIEIIIIIIIIILILFTQYLFRKKYSIDSKKINTKISLRILYIIIGVILLYNICISPTRFIKLNIQNDLGNNYAWMGGNATFFINLGAFYFERPNEYCEENIKKIREKEQYNVNISKNKNKSNVIMIMNESFSNPNSIKNVEYSINPINNIEELAQNDKNCIIGNTITPVYGGGTSLPEFEALTGLSSYFIEKQIFPYTSYIKNNMNSIVRTYKQNGYTTIGIHTNTETFYNRKNVYKYLGFEKTVFSQDINKPEYKGGNISDNEFANQIIKKFENNSGNKYIFGVTMQNHMPYNQYGKYEKYDVDINSKNLTEREKTELKNYIQGIYDSDQMYIKLVNYFRNVNEPTILIMFGDHLPALNSIYKKSNYVNIDYYRTPYVIWSNYDINTFDIPKNISPSNLSLNITRLANVELPWYLKEFERLYKIYPVINNQYILTEDENKLNINDIYNDELINNCRILQYDLLIKKKYILIE